MLKKLFHTLNFFIIFLYLYPGSIIGYILYNNINRQPEISPDLVILSINHFLIFFFLTISGLISFKSSIKIIIYLFALSIILELMHIFIPKRSFQIEDLLGNLFGVIVALFILIIYKFWRRK